jgi:hypothetical protein
MFLGLRGSDALYRFHGRARIGMAIAVGHHFYSGGVDREAAAAEWTSWLDRVFA